MTQLEIFQTIAAAVNSAAASKNPRLTLVAESDFGGVYHLPVTAVRAEIAPYAQYKEALTIYFKKRGGRQVYGIRTYGTRPLAVFSGWPETAWEQPQSYQCFDKNLFYTLADSFPAEQKIAEESERVHLPELLAKGKIYKVVSMNSDRRMTCETFASDIDLKKSFETSGEFRSVSCRAELQGAPKLKNFCGPMYDGEDEHGNSVIRYESPDVNEILSA